MHISLHYLNNQKITNIICLCVITNSAVQWINQWKRDFSTSIIYLFNLSIFCLQTGNCNHEFVLLFITTLQQQFWINCLFSTSVGISEYSCNEWFSFWGNMISSAFVLIYLSMCSLSVLFSWLAPCWGTGTVVRLVHLPKGCVACCVWDIYRVDFFSAIVGCWGHDTLPESTYL